MAAESERRSFCSSGERNLKGSNGQMPFDDAGHLSEMAGDWRRNKSSVSYSRTLDAGARAVRVSCCTDTGSRVILSRASSPLSSTLSAFYPEKLISPFVSIHNRHRKVDRLALTFGCRKAKVMQRRFDAFGTVNFERSASGISNSRHLSSVARRMRPNITIS